MFKIFSKIFKKNIGEIKDEEKTIMPNEEVKDKKIEETAETEKKDGAVEQTEEKETEVEKTEETPTSEEKAPTVRETTEESSAIGIKVTDLVTKEELLQKLSAIEAKFDAVVKENQDLKDRYETKDFGNNVKRGIPEKDKLANSTFEEYSRQFM